MPGCRPRFRLPAFWLAGGFLLLVPGQSARGISISVYVAAPNTVSSPATGGTALTDTYDSWQRRLYTAPVTGAVGTYQLSSTSALRVQDSDQYGGAGNTRYAAFGAQTGTSGAITLNLSNPATFFGLWWSAIDANNGISFYSGNHFLMRFTGADLISLFSASPTLTAQNGALYQSSAYSGKPGTNPPQNTAEYYAYTMFRVSGLAFTRVVFDNSGSAASGFEMDNLQIRTGNFTIPGTTVLLRSYEVQAVPEPSFWIPAAAALLWLARLRRRKTPPDSAR